jgi:hypothetical protein
MSELNINDFEQILDYYGEPIPKTKHLTKVAAEKLIASKLCRCIKKIGGNDEQRNIGICTKTIINRRGYARGKFKCKGTPTIKLKRRSRKNTRRKNK